VASGLVTLVLGDQQAQCPVSTHFAQPGPVFCGEESWMTSRPSPDARFAWFFRRAESLVPVKVVQAGARPTSPFGTRNAECARFMQVCDAGAHRRRAGREGSGPTRWQRLERAALDGNGPTYVSRGQPGLPHAFRLDWRGASATSLPESGHRPQAASPHVGSGR
jgi:hypothetical protein